MRQGMRGWGSGLMGVVIFSGSLPATRVAVHGFSPLFLTSARAVIAALIGGAALMLLRQRPPGRGDLGALTIIGLGVVVGFPLLTAEALQHISAARSVVFIGLLPLMTAAFAVIRAGERPRLPFWLFAGLGAALIAGFSWQGGQAASPLGDGLMLAAITVCGLGYAEGAKLSRRLGGWQVICWALLLALPAMAPIAGATRPQETATIAAPAWLGLGYVSVFSMLVGFVFWYRGLAAGGIAGVGQLQLLQPLLGLALAGLVLGEPVGAGMVATSLMVLGCVAAARRYA